MSSTPAKSTTTATTNGKTVFGSMMNWAQDGISKISKTVTNQTKAATATATTATIATPARPFPARNQLNPFAFGTTGAFAASGLSSIPLQRIIGYLFLIGIVIFVILLVIHYYITPIFQSRPGSPGHIYIGTDDGVLFWDHGMTPEIAEKDTPIASQSYGYTMNMDLFIQDPIPSPQTSRVLMTRGAALSLNRPSSQVTPILTNLYSQYNLIVALQPTTNDLLISVLNKDKNQENIILTNVPIQKTFRLGVVVQEKNMEAYINGKLMKTVTFSASPLDVKGAIQGGDPSVARVRNLKIWSHVLTTGEIANATPSMPSDSKMGGLPMPSTSLCGIQESVDQVSSNILTMQ